MKKTFVLKNICQNNTKTKTAIMPKQILPAQISAYKTGKGIRFLSAHKIAHRKIDNRLLIDVLKNLAQNIHQEITIAREAIQRIQLGQ